MPWDALKQALTVQKTVYTPTDPLWKVTGPNKASFHAHPAFLDSVRLAGGLPDLLTATDRDLGTALGKWRVTLDGHLAEVPGVRATLGLADHRFTELDDEIGLLRYADGVRQLPGGNNPEVVKAATAFAEAKQPATVHDFMQVHSFFLSAVNSFGGAYDKATYPGRAETMYALAVGSPAAAGAGPIRLGGADDWQTHQPGFALAIHAESPRLNFATRNALAAHALKHVLRGTAQIPGTPDGINALVATYLQEARDKITTTPTASATSALAQTGATRTYYFGTLTHHMTMIAVTPSGNAWISTYYAPTRT
ncbi:hypothetical protein [Actinacidiphila acididurans]|uniref:Uncharacterized protein n=1 Tax=Actinacidiphila acididurans TaxID=2784346 RepID=A0ABS2TNH8_9ACTN|nr:hypothetical protein [Actinacidiphila acididurans]MBM9504642.1 hypothetical protein [Actinacidiphila acididurans]